MSAHGQEPLGTERECTLRGPPGGLPTPPAPLLPPGRRCLWLSGNPARRTPQTFPKEGQKPFPTRPNPLPWAPVCLTLASGVASSPACAALGPRFQTQVWRQIERAEHCSGRESPTFLRQVTPAGRHRPARGTFWSPHPRGLSSGRQGILALPGPPPGSVPLTQLSYVRVAAVLRTSRAVEVPCWGRPDPSVMSAVLVKIPCKKNRPQSLKTKFNWMESLQPGPSPQKRAEALHPTTRGGIHPFLSHQGPGLGRTGPEGPCHPGLPGCSEGAPWTHPWLGAIWLGCGHLGTQQIQPHLSALLSPSSEATVSLPVGEVSAASGPRDPKCP